jgi:hypothetical protein
LDLDYLGIKDNYPKLNCALPIKRKNPGRCKIGVRAEEFSVEQKASIRRWRRSELSWSILILW